MHTPLNGSFWPVVAKSAVGLLVTIVITLVSCQQATISTLGTRVDTVNQKVTIHEEVLREREQYIQQLKDLDKSTTGDLNRLEIRMVRIEMMMQQMMLAENVRPPKGLPKVPPPEG